MLDYQDALWPNGTLQGERGCAERWALIAPELPETGVLLDIGSNLGFYGITAAKSHTAVAVVSVEADQAIAAEQARIVAANGLDRIVVLEASINAATAEQWADTCDMVDCCLLLSVVHWFDDPARVLAALGRLSRTLLIELPDAADSGACGGEKRALWGADPGGWLESVTGRGARLIGRPSRHTSEVKSWLFAVDGALERSPQVPYIGSRYEHPRGRDYRLSADASGTRLWVRGVERPWIPAVNVANLAALGRCRYPGINQLRNWWNAAHTGATGHLDPAPHNLLWGAGGLVLIDGDDLDGRINRPNRQMHRFLRRWVRGSGYDGGALARIGENRRTRVLQKVKDVVPAPLKRPLLPFVRALRSGLQGWRPKGA